MAQMRRLRIEKDPMTVATVTTNWRAESSSWQHIKQSRHINDEENYREAENLPPKMRNQTNKNKENRACSIVEIHLANYETIKFPGLNLNNRKEAPIGWGSKLVKWSGSISERSSRRLACCFLYSAVISRDIRAVFKWLSKVITWLRLPRLVIGLKDSRQFF